MLADIGKKDKKVVAITDSNGRRNRTFQIRKAISGKIFDVGIAEEHAMTFAAGLAAGGMKPVFVGVFIFLTESI